MKLEFRKWVTELLILAFSAAIISDIIYGKSELANEYLIGQFIGQVFNLSMAFAFVLCLLWFMFTIFLKKFFEEMFYCYHAPLEERKKVCKIKTKRRLTTRRRIKR